MSMTAGQFPCSDEDCVIHLKVKEKATKWTLSRDFFPLNKSSYLNDRIGCLPMTWTLEVQAGSRWPRQRGKEDQGSTVNNV